MLDLAIIAAASVAGMFLGARLAYGSWAWEWRKTWYGTRSEIAFLRAVKENQREKIEQLTDELHRERHWITRRNRGLIVRKSGREQ